MSYIYGAVGILLIVLAVFIYKFKNTEKKNIRLSILLLGIVIAVLVFYIMMIEINHNNESPSESSASFPWYVMPAWIGPLIAAKYKEDNKRNKLIAVIFLIGALLLMLFTVYYLLL